MKTRSIVGVAAFVLLMAFVILPARSGADQSSNQLSAHEALELVRTINTAELEMVMTRGAYHSLEDLLQSRFFENREIVPTLKDIYTATVKDYKLSIVTFAEGKQYVVSLVPTGEPQCRPALFSDQVGVIYPGKSLGCPEE